MKKLLIFLVIVFLSLSFVKTKADCPPGYTQHTLATVYSYSTPETEYTCHVMIVYCCKWDNNLKKIVIEVDFIFTTYSYHCLALIPDENHFSAWLHNAIASDAKNFCSPPYPPCDDNNNPYYIAEINIAGCWYYKNWQPYYPDDVYGLWRFPCKNSNYKCRSIWKICMDYNVTPPEPRKILISKTPVSDDHYCHHPVPQMPPPGKTWDEYWETDCFSTECN